MTQHQVVVLVVEHGEWAEPRRHAGRTGHSLWMAMTQEALKDRRRIHINKQTTSSKPEDSKKNSIGSKPELPSHLHVRMVGGLEGLIQGRRAVSLTAICVEPLGMHNPLVPTNVVKVHPHVHLATQRPLHRLRCRCSSTSHSHPLHSVPFVPSTLAVTADSVHGHVLGVLHSVNETVCSVAFLRQVVFGEDDHHDPVCYWMVYFSLPRPQILEEGLVRCLPVLPCTAPTACLSLSGGLLAGHSVSLVQPEFQQSGHIKNLPGRLCAAGRRAKAPQEKVIVLAWCAARVTALLPGVIQIHSGSLGGREGW